jgi:hypothetical protein
MDFLLFVKMLLNKARGGRKKNHKKKTNVLCFASWRRCTSFPRFFSCCPLLVVSGVFELPLPRNARKRTIKKKCQEEEKKVGWWWVPGWVWD